ncbi:hypothetical protein LTR37_002644 [Vermiconidia calcicola]|uniref:Uncharacterized protein n=1 Tax=Vermiconidia calcicola TaxID=1690605 RepID=A0ACC3NSL7_9PEZI|nr:hypothetical protein LTR37_002644 [Vermiconidia calcicola]
MPHATGDETMVDMDESSTIQSFLNQHGAADIGDSLGHTFDQGNKAEDAIDYEDISDEDDLPEEEEATNRVSGDGDPSDEFDQLAGDLGGLPVQPPPPHINAFHDELDAKDQYSNDLFGESDETHDLFGDSTSSPEQKRAQPASHAHPSLQRPSGLALPSKSSLALPGISTSYQQQPQLRLPQQSSGSMSPPSFGEGGYSPAASIEDDDLSDDAALTAGERMQRRLFKLAARKQAGEDVDETLEEIDLDVFYSLFPSFEKNQNPSFVKLFPPRPAKYRGKAPLKPPRPVIPTKLSLDIMPDQEKTFKAPGLLHKAGDERSQRDGLVYLHFGSRQQEDSDDDVALSSLNEDEQIGGVTMQDLAVICGDWDMPGSDTASITSVYDRSMGGEWEGEESPRPRKRQRTDAIRTDYALAQQESQPSLENPELATAKLAKSVALDLNDPNLLIDELAPQKMLKTTIDSRRNGISKKSIAKRYNISNDEAYDLLKENHQHKVRSTLGSLSLEHSLPATKLQFPFYRISLDNKTKRSFHRPSLEVRDGRGREFRFQRHKHTKRKHLRGKEAKEIFGKAEDLILGDNSNVLLLEYSEEAPTMLSNFGMGNRLINYYRKRDTEDQERPKREIGETQVLLTQDKSPFANFGHVDKGEIVPTVQNGIYRAPVFQHKAKSTDFLVGLSSTYQGGHRFYIRNVENLHIVGQQFPLAEVPGEHSRKVTDAAKKRLRALSYRMYTKSADPTRRAKPLNNENLMPHLPGHDMPQTRSKMREFMKYERAPGKDSGGVWVPPPGQVVPDADTLRSWIKPEDVCLLDSMQVGVQHLRDLGINGEKDADEDKDLDEGANIEEQLAPWRTSKNFIAACQGKAMLTVHGEGDPTGRGEGFSFVKTSMKGGFRAVGESAADKIEAKKRRETGGHSYNVAQQQKAYDDSIRTVWNRQKDSLTAALELSDTEMDDDADDPQSAYPARRGATPRSSFGTPGTFARHDDESASQFSRGSADRGDKVLTITRKTIDKYGKPATTYEKVTNPRVIASYRKKKMEKQLNAISVLEMNPTGDAEMDALKRQQLEKELARISRNAERRVAREKQKGKHAASPAAGSPGPSDPDGTTPQKGRGRNKDGTARKCANCGQVGHIKTNRKLCPMLNGTMKPEDAGANGDSSFGAVPAPLTL